MSQPIGVIGGIDTHTDVRQAAVIDTIGRHLATGAFPTTPAGYRRLLAWLRSHGRVIAVGMEGTGSFGAEQPRHLCVPGHCHRGGPPRPSGSPVCGQVRPRRRLLTGVGTETAGQLLVTAGDNPDRLASQACFAHLCAAAPVPASCGRTDRHRLNWGGDHQANRALHTIVLVRMRHHQCTRDYVAKRTLEGLKTKDIVRCLKRFVACEVYRHLTSTFGTSASESPAA